ncbi:polyprotein [Moniliophthora roreri MCA 2997]|uniref:Polyprotein n=1 Tax=Moniliophthora roreri (strain MCA 2997) TaxID=1381753 RepID=V2WKJ6_MONRO|nr:polyprotein [Moniliophthora roreri MCA 2997]
MPDGVYDTMIYDYIHVTGINPDLIPSSPWVDCALQRHNNAAVPKLSISGLPKWKYKPFKEIPPSVSTILPTHPAPYSSLQFTKQITKEHLDLMLSKIEPGTLSSAETDLLAFVVLEQQSAFAFNYSEKGIFHPEYYPDYKIPTIEHVPWQKPPIPVPLAI